MTFGVDCLVLAKEGTEEQGVGLQSEGGTCVLQRRHVAHFGGVVPAPKQDFCPGEPLGEPLWSLQGPRAALSQGGCSRHVLLSSTIRIVQRRGAMIAEPTERRRKAQNQTWHQVGHCGGWAGRAKA